MTTLIHIRSFVGRKVSCERSCSARSPMRLLLSRSEITQTVASRLGRSTVGGRAGRCRKLIRGVVTLVRWCPCFSGSGVNDQSRINATRVRFDGRIMVRGPPEGLNYLHFRSLSHTHSYALFTVPPWWTHAVATIYNCRNGVPLKHICLKLVMKVPMHIQPFLVAIVFRFR